MPLAERLGLRPPPAARRSRSLTASGQRVEKADSATLRRLIQPWQHRALGFYETLGEINFAAQFYARTLAKIRYFPAILDENGVAQETEDAELRALWDRVQDPGGGRTNLMTAYGQLMFLCGDCYLVCTGATEPDEEETWEILSVAELRSEGDGKFRRIKAPGLAFEDLVTAADGEFQPMDGEVVVYRLYRPDPRFRALADAPMRGVLTLCEELVLLDLAVRARARSRAAGPGVLLVSDSLTTPPVGVDQNDDDVMSDPFFANLVNSLMAPLSDPGSAAAVMPHIITVPDTLNIDNVMKLIKFADPQESYQEMQQRGDCVKRMATGLDFPPEQLLGMTDANHWTAWIVDENSWKAHLMPVTQRACDDFASAYLRPAAKEAGIANWSRVTVGYDAAEVINHPDRAKDAKDLYAQRSISKKALREAAGFDDDDAMPEDELQESIGVAVRDGSLALYGIPSVKAGGIEPEPGVIENAAGESSAPTGPVTGAEVEAGPPAAAPEPRTASAALLTLETAKLLGVAEAHLERARDLAGNRIRNRSKGCEPCQQRIGGQPSAIVASLLGVEQTRLVLNGTATERDLVAGTSEAFARTAVRHGVTDRWAAELGELVETHAARTLYEEEPPPLPASFAALAARALTVEPVAA